MLLPHHQHLEVRRDFVVVTMLSVEDSAALRRAKRFFDWLCSEVFAGLIQLWLAADLWLWPHPLSPLPSPGFRVLYEWVPPWLLCVLLAVTGLVRVGCQGNRRWGNLGAWGAAASCLIFSEIAAAMLCANPRTMGFPLMLSMAFFSGQAWVALTVEHHNKREDL